MRTENWCGYDIRFVEVDGEWWAILKDICDALNLRTDKVAFRLDPDMLIRVPVKIKTAIPSKYSKTKDVHPSRGLVHSNEFSKTAYMIAVNEIGIYEALFASRRLEARQFRRWSATILQKLRNKSGLKQYDIFKLTDSDFQDSIDRTLDTLFYDENTGLIMQSVLTQNGDVEEFIFK